MIAIYPITYPKYKYKYIHANILSHNYIAVICLYSLYCTLALYGLFTKCYKFVSLNTITLNPPYSSTGNHYFTFGFYRFNFFRFHM